MQVEKYRELWEKKSSLRAVYQNYSLVIFDWCVTGRTLEIGGGSGNLDKKGRNVVTTDIQIAPWLDLVADAQSLPFATASFDNIVMLDVLHHIETPSFFFKEAARVLKKNGRVVMLEPAITPVSWLFYKVFHDEPVNMSLNPLDFEKSTHQRDPYDSNQAIPTLLFKKMKGKFEKTFPELRIITTEYLSLFAYPLSGGFKPWTLIPSTAVPFMLSLERYLLPFIGPLSAFRLLVVLERA